MRCFFEGSDPWTLLENVLLLGCLLVLLMPLALLVTCCCRARILTYDSVICFTAIWLVVAAHLYVFCATLVLPSLHLFVGGSDHDVSAVADYASNEPDANVIVPALVFMDCGFAFFAFTFFRFGYITLGGSRSSSKAGLL